MRTVEELCDTRRSPARPLWDGFLKESLRPLASAERDRLANKRILITGAGGFLGSALARALAALPVAQLTLLDHAEYGLYKLDQDLRCAGQRPPATFIVGSVLNRALLREIFVQHAPQIVFHAAALKHVPLMQTNAVAAAETNVLGTQAVVRAASHSHVERFVLLSTDKAVDPVSIMGATKRIAEQIVLRERDLRQQQFIVLRLCNVLGSTGSVAPLFASQISSRTALTLTHAQATRFFVSGGDAVSLLLRAATLPSETGLIVPLLEHPYLIRDFAAYLLQRFGDAGHSGEIIETGLRPGDRLHEQLKSSCESAQLSAVPGALAVHSNFNCKNLRQALIDIKAATKTRDTPKLLQAICRAVPEYRSENSD